MSHTRASKMAAELDINSPLFIESSPLFDDEISRPLFGAR